MASFLYKAFKETQAVKLITVSCRKDGERILKIFLAYLFLIPGVEKISQFAVPLKIFR